MTPTKFPLPERRSAAAAADGRRDAGPHRRLHRRGSNFGGPVFPFQRETGEAKVILTALCGHGHLDLPAYDAYLSGAMVDHESDESQLAATTAALPVM